ncbi:MAG: TonB-dependent receptor plug domain-containing protein, partial [Bacteroidota bacterium]
SFILGGRYAYPDWVIKRVPDLDIQRSSGMFYDVTAKFHHEFNEKNNLSLSAFLSEDQFKLAGDTLYGWNTKNMTFKWNSVLSKKIFVGFTALYSNYEYYINGQRAPDLYTATFGVLTRGAKVDFTYAPDLDHKVEFGASANRYDFSPGKMDVAENSAINSVSLPLEQSDESALYVSDEIKLHQNVTVSAGVRLSHYRNIGPGNVFIYQEGAPQSVSTIVDTVSFSSGKPIRQYSGVEPRLSVRLALDDQSSIKASYNRNIQYLHLISNTAAISPLDLWKSSNYHIKPETGNQFAVGYFRNLKNNMIETSLEIYYKEVEN